MTAPLLGMRAVSKQFGALKALDGVDFTCARGEIHALLGENGAGKSTLMNVAGGLLSADAGEISLDGQPVRWRSPREARARGIAMVHQHFMLVPTLTIAENVALARHAFGLLDRGRLASDVGRLAGERGLDVGDPSRRIEDLSVGEQQRVEILKALVAPLRLLILDEPTAVLTPREVEDLFGLLRTLAGGGAGIVIVTHKLAEVRSLAGRVTVLRRGQVAGSGSTRDLDEATLARLMVGAEGGPATTRTTPKVGPPVLQVDGLTAIDGPAGGLGEVSFEVGAGEILAIAGVEGNGQAELIRALSGQHARVERGRVLLAGRPLRNPAEARRAGLAVVPPDRRQEGLVGELALWENLLLGCDLLSDAAPRGVLEPNGQRSRASASLADFGVQPQEPAMAAANLSGGNQQRLVLARELSRPRLRAVIAANPTRGLDFGATRAIHGRLRELAARGVAILVFSTDLDEVQVLATRIAVLFRGRLHHLPPGDADRGRIGALMAGLGGAD